MMNALLLPQYMLYAQPICDYKCYSAWYKCGHVAEELASPLFSVVINLP
jgi:hypothetical protein